LGLGAAVTTTLGSLAKCLVGLIPEIGLEVFATSPTFVLGCHSVLIFQGFPAWCKGKKAEARKATAEKKEENFLANCSKKIQSKKIPFQTGGFDPFPLRRWQGGEWRAKGVSEEVPRILRHLQTVRLGRLQMGQHVHRTLMTQIPKSLNDQLQKLGLAALFAAPPKL
jgi:hypothetical protein